MNAWPAASFSLTITVHTFERVILYSSSDLTLQLMYLLRTYAGCVRVRKEVQANFQRMLSREIAFVYEVCSLTLFSEQKWP